MLQPDLSRGYFHVSALSSTSLPVEPHVVYQTMYAEQIVYSRAIVFPSNSILRSTDCDAQEYKYGE